MKQSLVLLGCCIVLLSLAGCQNANKGAIGAEAMQVIVEDDGKFPEFLVGEWKADKGGWVFNFKPDGTISYAVISMARVRMKPGEITTVPLKMDGKGVFEPGEWLVHYIPATRELTVKIILKHFNMEMGDSILEGSITDVFVGEVDEGANVWQAEWTSFTKITGHTPEYPTMDLSGDPVYGVTESLIFEKFVRK
ncbi:MAG: hypothetical protein JSV82_01895 [Planctomycetota bacterium]|nr:MAG: hypothetical protein JSV82_01895 [Planctomycetota bacterium]